MKTKKAGIIILLLSIWALFQCKIALAAPLFETKIDFQVGNGPVFVATGDLNGDGDLDLAVTNIFFNSVAVLLGNGDGTFQTAVGYGAGYEPNSVAMGDLDGDGDLDLAVANFRSDNVSVFINNSTSAPIRDMKGMPWLFLLFED